MSALRSFKVRLLVGRTLTRSITADSAELAEAIAHYLFTNMGPHSFYSSDEDIVDLQAEEETTEVGQ
jgi:hypothetical protein